MQFSALVNIKMQYSAIKVKTMLHNRITEARSYAKLTQEDLAEKLNIGKRTLIDYEKGVSEPKASIIVSIAENCNISVLWLLTGEGEKITSLNHNIPVIQNQADKDDSTDIVTLNYYPDIVAAAGYGGINDFEIYPSQQIKIDRLFIEDILNIKHFNNIDVIRVIGDSMEPFIFDGEVVLIERLREAKNGETVIANINGHVYVKKFQTDPFGRWVKLVSNNGNYAEISLEGDQLEFFSIVGIVRAKIKAF